MQFSSVRQSHSDLSAERQVLLGPERHHEWGSVFALELSWTGAGVGKNYPPPYWVCDLGLQTSVWLARWLLVGWRGNSIYGPSNTVWHYDSLSLWGDCVLLPLVRLGGCALCPNIPTFSWAQGWFCWLKSRIPLPGSLKNLSQMALP